MSILINKILTKESKTSNNNNNAHNNINNIPSQFDEKLLFVWEHFRHGARGPYTKVSPVTWKDFIGVKWKGQGELTPIGMRMHYLLGTAMKKHYSSFLSTDKYNPNEILIISTDVNRTILSAYANLQGMYNKTTSDKLTNTQISRASIPNKNKTEEMNKKIYELKNNILQGGINLLPVHVYSVNYGLQFKLNSDSVCPGVKKYKEESKKQKKIIEIFAELADITNKTFGEEIFKFMNKSGIENPKYLWDPMTLFYICDTFISNYVENKTMPHIRKTGIDLEKFYHHSLNVSFIKTYYYDYGSPLTKTTYITMSPVFRNIFNYMDRRIDLDKKKQSDLVINDSPRFVIISGHDSTLAANDLFLKEEFGVSFDRPEYCSSEVYELWKNLTTGKYFVKYLVNQEVKTILEYQGFKNKVNEIIYGADEIEEICYGEKKRIIVINKNIIKTTFYITFPLMIISCLIFILLNLIHKRKGR